MGLSTEKAAPVGKRIEDLRGKSSIGASVVAIIRDEEVLPNPGAGVEFKSGDMIGVLGTPEQREAFRKLAGGS